MSSIPWFQNGFELINNIVIETLTFSDDKWQIYQLTDKQNILIVCEELVILWDDIKLLDKHIWGEIEFNEKIFFYMLSSNKYTLAPITYKNPHINKISALSFAIALRESRKISQDISFKNSLYIEQFSRLLPVSDLHSNIDDILLLGTWLMGTDSITSVLTTQLKSFNQNISNNDLKKIIENVGVGINIVAKSSNEFSLPGMPYLEKFFFENVIDIILNPDKYMSFGINFPSPIILYGKPGTGKSYATQKLADFLSWPTFFINSNSIGSPYIHETGIKISNIFNKAFSKAPSIIIIDEMEAYLSKRNTSQNSKIEETGEFLRLIPEASNKKVLIIAMTNLLENIDPAILRTGRFDHKIEVFMPTKNEIKIILNEALAKIPVENDINLEKIIEILIDKPRSDIAFVIKEVARLTAFKGKSKISQDEIDEVLKQTYDRNLI
jgi:Cdc6-like AAA superfamily ATPase